LSDQSGFDMLAGDPAVKLVGFIEDLSEYYDWARVMVVPLRYGSGVKGKVLTALSYGVPCVSTRIGSEGMGLTPGTDILQADEPADFAREVVRLYTDEALWKKLSENGLRFVQENFSVQLVRRELLRIFAQTDVVHREVLPKP
jgi:glycosyltransferase involved in cell wall biosynthesis